MPTHPGRKAHRIAAATLVAAACSILVSSAQQPAGTLPLVPAPASGGGVTPAFEGWYQNADGSYSFLVGYYNRNTREALDIPVGPNNKVEPGLPDQGQPTHFETGRQWGVFTIKVPKDFGNKTVTWTIVANGEKNSIPLTLNKGYPIAPFKEIGMGNQPPVLSFAAGGPKFTGPPVGTAATFTGKVGEPVTLTVWAEDVKVAGGEGGRSRGGSSIANLSFHEFRGPGKVTFNPMRVSVAKQGDMASTAATFSAAGEYLLRVQANDESGEGGGGFQCCWTNAYVKVTIQ